MPVYATEGANAQLRRRVYILQHTFIESLCYFATGWRRFQAVPVYATEDANARLRALKYTPEHMHCSALVWGALAPPNTGNLLIETQSDHERISAAPKCCQSTPWTTCGVPRSCGLLKTGGAFSTCDVNEMRVCVSLGLTAAK